MLIRYVLASAPPLSLVKFAVKPGYTQAHRDTCIALADWVKCPFDIMRSAPSYSAGLTVCVRVCVRVCVCACERDRVRECE